MCKQYGDWIKMADTSPSHLQILDIENLKISPHCDIGKMVGEEGPYSVPFSNSNLAAILEQKCLCGNFRIFANYLSDND